MMLVKIVGNSLLKRVRITVWTLATLSACAALVSLFAALAVDAEKKMSGSLRRLGANAVVYSDAEPSGGMTAPGSVGMSPEWEAVKGLAGGGEGGVAALQGRGGAPCRVGKVGRACGPRLPSGARRGRNGRSDGPVPARKAGYGLPGSSNPATRMRTGSFSPFLPPRRAPKRQPRGCRRP